MIDAGKAQVSDIWSGQYLAAMGACPYCGNATGDLVVSGVEDWFFHNVPGQFAFNRCTACLSLWQPAPVAASHLPHAYATYYTHTPAAGLPPTSGLKAALQQAYTRQRYAGRRSPAALAGSLAYRLLARNRVELDAWFRFAPAAPGKVLDFGCGGGEFLRLMADHGYATFGVDFDPVVVSALRETGLHAYLPEEFDCRDWSGFFDAISLNHVIEHVFDPADLLARLAGMLKPGGTLFIEAPNASAAGLTIFGRYWRGLEAPRHLNLPAMAGIQLALDNAGLRLAKHVIRRSVRAWIWEESLNAVPAAERSHFTDLCSQAPVETLANAELITLVATKVHG
jgi:2-polyprenyl-3-methyl-5-hydroxy-6-metoxy-1,4-benzoquinol methylase